jgi:hypothetical protein
MVLSGKMPPPPSIPVSSGGSLRPAAQGGSLRPPASPAPHGDSLRPPAAQGDSLRPPASLAPRGDSLRPLSNPVPARGSLRPPPERVGGITCRELVEIASLPHYQLRVDRKCRLVMARRTTTPFQGISEIRDCFRDIQIKLADIPRKSYHLLVDARFGPSRNDRGFELVLEEERGKLLFGFARNAALAATAAGRLQIQRFAKQDGREVFATDDPSRAFDYLGLRPHLV